MDDFENLDFDHQIKTFLDPIPLFFFLPPTPDGRQLSLPRSVELAAVKVEVDARAGRGVLPLLPAPSGHHVDVALALRQAELLHAGYQPPASLSPTSPFLPSNELVSPTGNKKSYEGQISFVCVCFSSP